MEAMFRNTAFNGDISKWNTGKVTSMCGMFMNSPFNGNLSQWNTSRVRQMAFMFSNCSFQGDISLWDTSSVVSMSRMFVMNDNRSDLSSWNLEALNDDGAQAVFSTFHECPLQYLMIVTGTAEFPEEDPRAAQFHSLRALTASLDLSPLRAAQYIYQALHSPTPMVDLPTSFALE